MFFHWKKQLLLLRRFTASQDARRSLSWMSVGINSLSGLKTPGSNMQELTGDNLTPKELEVRKHIIERLLEFQRTQGCQGCRQSEKDSAKATIYQMPFVKLQKTYKDTFGYDAPV